MRRTIATLDLASGSVSDRASNTPTLDVPGDFDRTTTSAQLDLASHLLPKVIHRMRQQFPDAKTFGATRPYFTELHADHLKRQRIAEASQSAHLEEQLEAEQRQLDNARQVALETAWQSLPAHEQQSIRETVLVANPRLRLDKHPTLLIRFCLNELSQRQPADK